MLLPWEGDDPDELRRAIRAAIEPEPRHAILLLGPVPEAPGSAGVPTFRFDQPDPLLVDRRDPGFVSDGPYQDFDDDGVPDLMLGRVPARDLESAQRILAKIRSAESNPPSDASRRVEILGGEGRFGPYDALLELLTASLLIESVPGEYDLRVSYAKPSSIFCPPPSRLRTLAREQALSGSLLFNYIGHGHAEGLDKLVWKGGTERILDAPDLAGEVGSFAPGGVALLVCCSAGWFDQRERPSFAEALLTAPTGPIAVFAGSRPTHPYANAFVERDGLRSLLRDRPALVGQWALAITRPLAIAPAETLDLVAAPIARSQRWKLSLRDLRRQHALLYNLIGDPATRLVYAPRAPAGAWRLEDGVLEGTIDGVQRGEVEVRLLKRRSAVRDDVPAPRGAGGDLEARALRDWARANDWTLWRTTLPIDSGRFRVALPDPIARGADLALVVVRDGMPRGEESPAASGQAVAVLAAESVPISPLLRSRVDGQGLPSDRRAEPGRP